MLIVRAPVRISFAGGGTDLPAYYEKCGGCVISTTIDKHFYVILGVRDDEQLQIISSDYGVFYRHNGEGPPPWDGELRLPRAILHHFGVTRGVRLFLASEVPPGTGLGSSSTVAVAVVKAITSALGQRLSRSEIAELASHIEIDKLGSPIGKQDHYAPSFGGLNLIVFNPDGVSVEPLHLPLERRRRLEEHLLLFYTGAARQSSTILARQKEASQRNDVEVMRALHAVKALVPMVREHLESGDMAGFGQLLHLNWEHKKRFAPDVSNSFVDDCYATARRCGALGGKLTGAGGGGFLMLVCEPCNHGTVTNALEECGAKRMDFRFDDAGVQVLVNAIHRLPSRCYAKETA